MRRPAGLIAMVGLFGVLVLTGCAPQGSTPPADLVGSWKPVSVLDWHPAPHTTTRSNLVFYAKPLKSADTWTNTSFDDACDSGSLLATFPAPEQVTLGGGYSILQACNVVRVDSKGQAVAGTEAQVPMNDFFSRARWWHIIAPNGAPLLVLYDKDSRAVASFVRTS